MGQRVRGEAINGAVVDFANAAVTRRNHTVALVTRKQVREDFIKANRQQSQQIERLDHAADSARRCHFAVELGIIHDSQIEKFFPISVTVEILQIAPSFLTAWKC